ncbi:Ig-like domain-containing protein, partial [Phenylobacterium sp.]|uniref:Ig-like domain-containing protein n=1 Tax=Phenylobacterium sp. TaxID=1871053 RepID=UPI00271FC0E1
MGDNVYVNAATGNLIVQNTDEMLIGLGEDDAVARTYNSLGTFTDDNGDNWRASVSRQVTGLTGTVNQFGSTVKRIDWDGSDVTYTYDTGRSAYVSKEGAGAYDTLTFSGSTWTWKDGTTRVTEIYDNNNGGRITSRADVDGNNLAFAYNGSGLVSRVTTQNGEYTDLVYAGTNLTQVETFRHADLLGVDTLSKSTRVSYGYDTNPGGARLVSITVDHSPNDNITTDNDKYVTTYIYDGTSKRIASIRQQGVDVLGITYTQVPAGGAYRVQSLTQTVGGVARTTTFTYNTTNRITTVTDPLGFATALAYDVGGQLTSITAPPAVSGAAAQVTNFAYNASGDVESVTAPDGAMTVYTYDDAGNRLSEVNGAGDRTERSYGTANNEVLTETRYLGANATIPLTTRYTYDSENHLRFVVGAEGDVTEYRYNAAGQQTSVIQYPANLYDVSALAVTATISENTLAAWVTAIADRSTTTRTDTTYDFRGNIATVTSYGKVFANGDGDGSTERSSTTYVYDQFGKLRSRMPSTASQAEVFLYDGLGRQISTTDFANAVTTVQFNDTASTTTVRLANDLFRTSTYDLAGELISYSESGTGVATATTTYLYDADGRLRGVTDPTGGKTHYLYDNAGRKIAEVGPTGTLTEYGYNAADQLIKTVTYKTQLSGWQLASLIDGAGKPAIVSVADIRPAADAADRWEWRVYDAAHRLIETIDATGAAKVFTYDAADRVTATRSYALQFSAAQLAAFKASPPSTLQVPGAAASSGVVTTNHGPSVLNDVVSATAGTATSITPLGNDTDADGNALTIVSAALASGSGNVSLLNDTTISFTPTAGSTGAATITYNVSDGTVQTVGTVTVNVSLPNTAPVAVADTISVTLGQSIVFDPRANDSDADAGDTLTVEIVSNPASGSVTTNGSTITYTAAASPVGQTSFTYRLKDRAGVYSSATTVTANAYNPNLFSALDAGSTYDWSDAGTGVAYSIANNANYQGDGFAVVAQKTLATANLAPYDGTHTFSGILQLNGATGGDNWALSGSDRLGVALEMKGVGVTDFVGISLFYWDVNWNSIGASATTTATLNGWTRVEAIINAPSNARYASLLIDTGATGDKRAANTTFGVALRKAQLVKLGSTQTMQPYPSMAPTNTAPVAANDTITTAYGTPVSFDPRLNDTDANKDGLVIQSVGTVTGGTLNWSGTGMSFTPNAGFSGTTSFTYVVRDPTGATSTGTVNLTVRAQERAPVANPDNGLTTPVGQALIFDPRSAVGGGADTDADGDALTITSATATN